MWVFERFLIVVNSVAACFSGLTILFWAVLAPKHKPIASDHLFTIQTRTLEVVILCALIVVALNVIYFLLRLFVRQREFIMVKMEPGEVAVSIGAIEDSLARAAQQVPEVHRARVTLVKNQAQRNSVRIRTAFSIWDDSSVKFASQKLQYAIQTRFRQLLGNEIVPTYDIALTRIVVRDAKKDKKEKEEIFRETFRGPEYPIDGGL